MQRHQAPATTSQMVATTTGTKSAGAAAGDCEVVPPPATPTCTAEKEEVEIWGSRRLEQRSNNTRQTPQRTAVDSFDEAWDEPRLKRGGCNWWNIDTVLLQFTRWSPFSPMWGRPDIPNCGLFGVVCSTQEEALVDFEIYFEDMHLLLGGAVAGKVVAKNTGRAHVQKLWKVQRIQGSSEDALPQPEAQKLTEKSEQPCIGDTEPREDPASENLHAAAICTPGDTPMAATHKLLRWRTKTTISSTVARRVYSGGRWGR